MSKQNMFFEVAKPCQRANNADFLEFAMSQFNVFVFCVARAELVSNALRAFGMCICLLYAAHTWASGTSHTHTNKQTNTTTHETHVLQHYFFFICKFVNGLRIYFGNMFLLFCSGGAKVLKWQIHSCGAHSFLRCHAGFSWTTKMPGSDPGW